MQLIKLSKVKKGDYIKRKLDSKQVWIRDEYERSTKKYMVTDTDDIGRSMLLKGSTLVFIGFEY
jgi:hypothetical protein